MTAARLVSFIAAEGVALDQLTGRATAFNMMDHLAVPGFPARQLRIIAIANYELGEEGAAFVERVRFVAPDETTITESIPLPLILTPRTPRQMPNGHRSIHMLWGSNISTPGDHHLILERQAVGEDPWEFIARLCLTVVVDANPYLHSGAPSVRPAAPAETPPLADDKPT